MQKIIHYVVIHSPPENVFESLTTQEGLSSWWSDLVRMKKSEQKIAEFTFLEGFNPKMELSYGDEPKIVKWKCIGGHDPWMDNIFTFELKNEKEETHLMFNQIYTNKISERDFGTYNFNWGYYLQSLKKYCETGKGTPYEPQT